MRDVALAHRITPVQEMHGEDTGDQGNSTRIDKCRIQAVRHGTEQICQIVTGHIRHTETSIADTQLCGKTKLFVHCLYSAQGT